MLRNSKESFFRDEVKFVNVVAYNKASHHFSQWSYFSWKIFLASSKQPLIFSTEDSPTFWRNKWRLCFDLSEFSLEYKRYFSTRVIYLTFQFINVWKLFISWTRQYSKSFTNWFYWVWSCILFLLRKDLIIFKNLKSDHAFVLLRWDYFRSISSIK